MQIIHLHASVKCTLLLVYDELRNQDEFEPSVITYLSVNPDIPIHVFPLAKYRGKEYEESNIHETKSTQYKDFNYDIEFDYPYDRQHGVPCDASLFFQFFSKIRNVDNQICNHRIGYFQIFLKDIVELTIQQKYTLSGTIDNETCVCQEQLKIPERGVYKIVFKDSTTFKTKIDIYFKVPTKYDLLIENVSFYSKTFRSYYETSLNTVSDIPIHQTIPVLISTFPWYTFGKYSQPPIGFLIMKTIPQVTEEYYLKSLDIILRNYYPSRDILGRIEAYSSLDTCSWNQRGSILVEVCSLLVHMYPYLTDYGIMRGKLMHKIAGKNEHYTTSQKSFSEIIIGETDSYEQHMRDILCSGDCEDMALEILIELAYIMEIVPTAKATFILKETRTQYIVLSSLKTVNIPTHVIKTVAAMQRGDWHRVNLVAHACVDLVPVHYFASLIKQTNNDIAIQTLQSIIKLREQTLIKNNIDLDILVGEGTVLQSPGLVEKTDYIAKWQHRFLRALPKEYKNTIHIPIEEDLKRPNYYYVCIVTSLIWDTIHHYTEQCFLGDNIKSSPNTHEQLSKMPSQIFWNTRYPNDNIIYRGLLHHEFISKSLVCVPRVFSMPSKDMMKMLLHINDFNIPIPPLTSTLETYHSRHMEQRKTRNPQKYILPKEYTVMNELPMDVGFEYINLFLFDHDFSLDLCNVVHLAIETLRKKSNKDIFGWTITKEQATLAVSRYKICFVVLSEHRNKW